MKKFVIFSEEYGYCKRGMKNLNYYQHYDFSHDVNSAIMYSTPDNALRMAQGLNERFGTVVLSVTVTIEVHNEEILDPMEPIVGKVVRFSKPEKSAQNNFLY